MEEQDTETSVEGDLVSTTNDIFLKQIRISLKKEDIFEVVQQTTDFPDFSQEQATEQILNSHGQQNHGAGFGKESSRARRGYACKKCRETFSSLRHLELHVCPEAAQRAEEILSKTRKENPLQCSICGKSFKQYAAYQRHEQSHINDEGSRDSHMSSARCSPGRRKVRGHRKHATAAGRTKRKLSAPEANNSQVWGKATRVRMQRNVRNQDNRRKDGIYSERDSQSIIGTRDGSRTRGRSSQLNPVEAPRRSLEVASSKSGSSSLDLAATLEDPLRLSAVRLNSAAKHETCSKNNNSLSNAWDILDNHCKEKSENHLLLSVKHSKSPGFVSQSSFSPSKVGTSDNKNPPEAKIICKELLCINLSFQERDRILNTSRILSIVSLLSDNVTELMKLLAKQQNDGKGAKVSETPDQAPSSGTVSRKRKCSPSTEQQADLGHEPDNIVGSDESNRSDSDYHDDSSNSVGTYPEDGQTMAKSNEKAGTREVRCGASKKRKPVREFCDICQKDFLHLKRHMLIHNSERSFKCDECGKAFFEKRVLEKHQTSHVKRFKCSVCGERFSKIRAARRHAKVHIAEKPYVCEICKRPFRTRRELRKHVIVHSSVKQFICHICGHGSSTRASFYSHQQRHKQEKAYVCETCGKAFKYSSGLHTHRYSHTTGKPYRCQICFESFKHNYLLKRHLLTHEGEEPHGQTLPGASETQDQAVCKVITPGAVHAKASGLQSNGNLSKQLLQTSAEDTSSISHRRFTGAKRSAISKDPLNRAVQPTLQSATCLSLVDEAGKGFYPSAPQNQISHPQGQMGDQLTTPQGEQHGQQVQYVLGQPLMQANSLCSNFSDSNKRESIPEIAPIQTTLGPNALKKNLTRGIHSRAQTVEASLVKSLCDGSYKSLKQLQRSEENK